MKNVLPIFELYMSSMYKLFHGVADYSSKHGWHLGITSTRFKLPQYWSGNGILTHLTNSRQLINFLSAHAGIPIVSFNPPASVKCNFPYAVVCADNEEIGRVAARYFMTLGDVNFCWYGPLHPVRFNAYSDELKRNNRETLVIKYPQNINNQPWDIISHQIVTQLIKLPLPCAVFCANDSVALELLEATQSVGLKVPEEIAILGVDNETLICNSSSVPISSIDSRLSKIGYEGAALLDRMMDGEILTSTPVLIPPVPKPIVRQSTDILANDNQIVARAVEFTRKNHTNKITVSDIAKTVYISESGLRKLMNRKIGISPNQMLKNLRMETACRLLRETELKIESVAVSAGFGNAHRLHELFRQVLKTTPTQFRLESKK